jgi:predicted metal-dependent hydrolase
MDNSAPEYDPRYLAGILLFNQGDFFEAHEVWEDAWMNSTGELKKYYQGLIQAAVGVLHFCNGNINGALKLYHSSRDKMRDLPSPYLGMDLHVFWNDMERCFAELLQHDATRPAPGVEEDLLPTITITPAPEAWPNPADFAEQDK